MVLKWVTRAARLFVLVVSTLATAPAAAGDPGRAALVAALRSDGSAPPHGVAFARRVRR
jgi:hypothetical protein